MIRRLPSLVLLGACAGLAGCGRDEPAPLPPEVARGEARALNEAAAMLEARPAPSPASVPTEAPAP